MEKQSARIVKSHIYIDDKEINNIIDWEFLTSEEYGARTRIRLTFDVDKFSADFQDTEDEDITTVITGSGKRFDVKTNGNN